MLRAARPRNGPPCDGRACACARECARLCVRAPARKHRRVGGACKATRHICFLFVCLFIYLREAGRAAAGGAPAELRVGLGEAGLGVRVEARGQRRAAVISEGRAGVRRRVDVDDGGSRQS